MMRCPYCKDRMEEGGIFSSDVPDWKGKSKFSLGVKKHLLKNEVKAFYCSKWNKISIEKAR